jgi:hypothetical protein
MGIRLKLTLERLDKDYQLLERREMASRSLTKHFIDLLYIMHAQVLSGSPYAIADITNTSRNMDSECSASGGAAKAVLLVAGAPGLHCQMLLSGNSVNPPYPDNVTIRGENLGIVVGTGVNAVSPTDYALQTKVAHGRAATQMEYGGCEPINIAFADPNGTFDLRRYFTNLSGGGIIIQEVGIYAGACTYGPLAGAEFAWSFCICRDLTGGVLVNNTELLRVTYTIQITV